MCGYNIIGKAISKVTNNDYNILSGKEYSIIDTKNKSNNTIPILNDNNVVVRLPKKYFDDIISNN